MSSNRKVVQIFLASPGDLQDERQTAKSVVDAFNKRWSDFFDIHIELVGWEDTFKRFGRPQAQINLELDRCEAFIGMMSRKWGSAPGGKYTSGFEEEFERALASRQKSSRPEMALFFKKIDDEFLKDQGPDLKKVLAFRQRIITEQLLFFQNFDELKDFEDKLTDWITHYIKQLKSLEQPASKPQEQVPSSEIQPEKPEAARASTVLGHEGAQFIREFVSKTEQDQETHPINPVEVARLRLLAGIAGVSGNDDEALGTHDANLLYQHRDQISLSRREMIGLVECGLQNISSETYPLWHWYVSTKTDDFGYLSLLTFGGSQNERVGALTAMRLIGEMIKPLGSGDPATSRRDLISSWLSPDANQSLRTAALDYLSSCGEVGDVPTQSA